MASFSIPFPSYEPPAVAQTQGATLGNMMAQRQLQQQQMQLEQQRVELAQQQIPLMQAQTQGVTLENQQRQMQLDQERLMLDAAHNYWSPKPTAGSDAAASTPATASASQGPFGSAATAPPANPSFGGMMNANASMNPNAGIAPNSSGTPSSAMMGADPSLTRTPPSTMMGIDPGLTRTPPSTTEAPNTTGAAPAAPRSMEGFIAALSNTPGLLPQSVITMRTNLLKMQQEAANLGKTHADTLKTHNEMIAQEAQGLLNLDPNQRVDAYKPALERMVQAGVMTQDEARQHLLNAPHEDDELRQMVARGTAVSTMIEAGQKQAAEWGKQMQNDIATTKSADDYQPLRQKYMQLGAPQAVVDQHLPEGKAWTPDLAQRAEQSLTPEGQRVKQEQDTNALWSNRFANAGTPQQYSYLLTKAPSDIAQQYRSLVPPEQFDPKNSPEVLRNAGLTDDQRTQADLRRTIELARIGYLDARTNALVNKPEFTPEFLTREHEKFEQLQTQEHQLWDLKGRLGDLIDPTKTPDGTQFIDPTGKSLTGSGNAVVTMDNAYRQRLHDAYVETDTKASGLLEQKDQMAQRYHWGKYATAAPTPPAAANAPAQTSSPTARPIQIRRGDGVVRTFPDEASAQRFESLVKNAGGSTSRMAQ